MTWTHSKNTPRTLQEHSKNTPRTLQEHSKNTNVISDFPSGKPARKNRDRVSFVGDVLEAIEVHDVAKMEKFLEECSVLDQYGHEAYPLMAKRLRKALR